MYRKRLLISAFFFDAYITKTNEVHALENHALKSKRLRYKKSFQKIKNRNKIINLNCFYSIKLQTINLINRKIVFNYSKNLKIDQATKFGKV